MTDQSYPKQIRNIAGFAASLAGLGVLPKEATTKAIGATGVGIVLGETLFYFDLIAWVQSQGVCVKN